MYLLELGSKTQRFDWLYFSLVVLVCCKMKIYFCVQKNLFTPRLNYITAAIYEKKSNSLGPENRDRCHLVNTLEICYLSKQKFSTFIFLLILIDVIGLKNAYLLTSLFISIYCPILFCISFETRSHVAKDIISFLILLAYISQILMNHRHGVTIPGDLTQGQMSVKQIIPSADLHPQLSIWKF